MGDSDKSTTPAKDTTAKDDEKGSAAKGDLRAQDGPEVDPRFDNRTGRQAPPLDAPLKPQQIHGGYPGDETDFEDPPSGERTTVYRSEGPHGRGPQTGPSSED